jgi:hypothetical protein
MNGTPRHGSMKSASAIGQKEGFLMEQDYLTQAYKRLTFAVSDLTAHLCQRVAAAKKTKEQNNGNQTRQQQ